MDLTSSRYSRCKRFVGCASGVDRMGWVTGLSCVGDAMVCFEQNDKCIFS